MLWRTVGEVLMFRGKVTFEIKYFIQCKMFFNYREDFIANFEHVSSCDAVLLGCRLS